MKHLWHYDAEFVFHGGKAKSRKPAEIRQYSILLEIDRNGLIERAEIGGHPVRRWLRAGNQGLDELGDHSEDADERTILEFFSGLLAFTIDGPSPLEVRWSTTTWERNRSQGRTPRLTPTTSISSAPATGGVVRPRKVCSQSCASPTPIPDTALPALAAGKEFPPEYLGPTKAVS